MAYNFERIRSASIVCHEGLVFCGCKNWNELNVTFPTDGTMNGSTVCDSCQAVCEVDGNDITIGLPISTMISCAELDIIVEQEHKEYLIDLKYHSHRQN